MDGAERQHGETLQQAPRAADAHVVRHQLQPHRPRAQQQAVEGPRAQQLRAQRIESPAQGVGDGEHAVHQPVEHGHLADAPALHVAEPVE